MQVFEFTDYRAFIKAKIKAMPRGGHGQRARMAAAMQMHTTSVSQMFRGTKDLSLEQAARLSIHFGLSELESDYFLNLVELERAAGPELREVLKKRLAKIKKQALNLSNLVPKDRVLSETERSVFYSNWFYSAIRLTCSLPGCRSVEQIAERLGLSRTIVNEALEFLLSSGLVIKKDDGFHLGPKRTYIDTSSTLVFRHHSNWRLKAIECFEKMDNNRDLALTAPMTLSPTDVPRIRQILTEAIEKIMKINTESESKELHFLNIDWLKL